MLLFAVVDVIRMLGFGNLGVLRNRGGLKASLAVLTRGVLWVCGLRQEVGVHCARCIEPRAPRSQVGSVNCKAVTQHYTPYQSTYCAAGSRPSAAGKASRVR